MNRQKSRIFAPWKVQIYHRFAPSKVQKEEYDTRKQERNGNIDITLIGFMNGKISVNTVPVASVL